MFPFQGLKGFQGVRSEPKHTELFKRVMKNKILFTLLCLNVLVPTTVFHSYLCM